MRRCRLRHSSAGKRVVKFLFAICLLVSALAAQEHAPARVTVDLTKRYQTIDGFGVNFNGTYFRESQKPMIDMLIDDYPRLTFYGLVHNADHMYTPKKRYYAAKQLYHFVRPGAQRVDAVSSDPGMLLVSAFYDGARDEVVLVGVKQGGPDQIELRFGGSVPMTSRLKLYQTTRALDCRKTDDVEVVDGMAHLDMPEDTFSLSWAKLTVIKRARNMTDGRNS